MRATLSLSGELRHDEDIGRDHTRSDSASMIAELVVPLYQAGAEYARVREAKELVLKAIANGKHVVTANKALLAVHGNEIFAAARDKGVMVAFEAAVAGGVPIIKALREGLTANRIQWIAGIINGTTNFILSEMRDKGLSFDTVLKEAQRLGYAEADPTFDVEGVDAAHKISILSSLAFGIPVQFDKAHVEGITKLEAEDIRYAEQLGYRIKLLGIARHRNGGIELRVHPTLIPAKRLIANVEGAMNAVLVQGDAVGSTLYYGKGAGAEPTASAVIADLVDVTAYNKNGVATLRRAFQADTLNSVVMRRLAARYQSAGDFASDLERFLHTYSPVFTATKLASHLRRARVAANAASQAARPSPAPVASDPGRRPSSAFR